MPGKTSGEREKKNVEPSDAEIRPILKSIMGVLSYPMDTQRHGGKLTGFLLSDSIKRAIWSVASRELRKDLIDGRLR